MKKIDSDRFWRRTGWGVPIAGILVVVISLVGISVGQANVGEADETTVEESETETSKWWHGKHRGRRGHHGIWGRKHDPERARDHMHYATGWMLHRLEVEDDVRDQIQARLDMAFDDLMPLMEGHRGKREAVLDVMLGDEIDRVALEGQRREAIAAVSEASEIIVTAFADIAEMMSPEQRRALSDRIEKRRGH